MAQQQRGFTRVVNLTVPAVVHLDNLEETAILSRWCFDRILETLRDVRIVNSIGTINERNYFLQSLQELERQFWSRDLYSILHDLYYTIHFFKLEHGQHQHLTGSLVGDFNMIQVVIWLRNRDDVRYTINFGHHLDGQTIQNETTKLIKGLLYYHSLLITCYAFRNRVAGMEMIYNENDIDGTREEFFNHPSHLATLHSLNGIFECPIPQNYDELTQLDNLFRKMIDLQGNNNSPNFASRRVVLTYEALEIHDPSISITMTAHLRNNNQEIRCDRIVNDVYRQSTLVINGFRLN